MPEQFQVIGTCAFCERLVYIGKLHSIPKDHYEDVTKMIPSQLEEFDRVIGKRMICKDCAGAICDMVEDVQHDREPK